MHIEILVEDQSGKVALETLVPKIVPSNVTFKVISYKGIGHLPKNLNAQLDPQKRVLLNRLPALLKGYGKSFANFPEGYEAALIVVCDLDDRDKSQFLAELKGVLDTCDPRPEAYFCLSIEEGEAWLLGHKDAVRTAYPDRKDAVIDAYIYDSICGTWECLADAVHKGGRAALKGNGHEAGKAKSEWASKISVLIDIEENMSPSFQFLVRTLSEICGVE